MAELSTYIPKLVLASQSIARKAVLEGLGIEVLVQPTYCDEQNELTNPDTMVSMLSQRKLDAYLKEHRPSALPVLCCDTVVAFEGMILGKSRDRSEAKRQLSLFSGRRQTVHSGWALWYRTQILCGCDQAQVWFKQLDEQSIDAYLDTGEWQNAAGSYRIQGAGKNLIDRIEGDVNVIIGLPILQITERLSEVFSKKLGYI